MIEFDLAKRQFAIVLQVWILTELANYCPFPMMMFELVAKVAHFKPIYFIIESLGPSLELLVTLISLLRPIANQW